jgi:hypothetical protein
MANTKKKGEVLSFVDQLIDKDDLPFKQDYLVRNMAIGFLAGMIVAIGGAVKDAPEEGFKPSTFIRSPLIGAIECPILAALIPNAHWFLLFLSVIGIERITIEIYKLFRAKKPGKFDHGEWGTPKSKEQNGNGFIHEEEIHNGNGHDSNPAHIRIGHSYNGFN